MTTLIVTQANDTVEEFEFAPNHSPISIGRRSGNDVAINCPSVSGLHAQIVADDEGMWIEDLTSTNGTYINGRLISRQRLEHGDDIVIGRARVTFLSEMTEILSPHNNPFLSERTEQLDVAAVAGQATSRESNDSVLNDGMEAYAERIAARHEANASEADVEDATPRRRHQDKAEHERPADADADVDVEDDFAGVDGMGSGYDDDGGDVVLASRARQVDRLSSVRDGRARAHALHGLDAADHALQESSADTAEFDLGEAAIQIINGAKSGTTMPIQKAVTTLGRPGIQIAAIMRKPEGYFLMHVESDDNISRPTINHDEIGDEPVLLHSGDELQVAGVEVQFQLSQ